MKLKKMLTENKKEAYKKEKKPDTKKNYNAKLKLDMSFKEALEKSINTKIIK
jgi:hypothetical protein